MKSISSLLLTLFFVFPIYCEAQFDPEQVLLDVSILASDSLEGRRTDTPGGEKAKNYLQKRFLHIGLKEYADGYENSFSQDEVSGINLVGYIPGKSDEVIVISAHYDHLGIRNDQIYNGADDNASGVAGILAIAEALKDSKPNHTLLFVAFDAEERGLVGSRRFVADPPVPLEKIKMNINLDMIAHNDKNEIYAAGGFHYKEVIPIINRVNETSEINVIAGHDTPGSGSDDWTNSSDHRPFHAKGIPFIYFGVEDHPDYHRATDVYENINKDFFIEVVKMLIETVKIVDQELN